MPVPPVPPSSGFSLDLIVKLMSLGKEGIKKLLSFLETFRSHTCKLLTYKDVINDVVSNRPNNPLIKKAAVLKKQTADGEITVTICYLDKDNEPVWGDDPQNPNGCTIMTKQLDTELQEMFGEKDVIIFE